MKSSKQPVILDPAERRWKRVITVAAVVGAILSFWPFMDARQLFWQRQHFRVIMKQLDDLKTHLQMHEAVHGSYPDNNEGLNALTNFDARFTLNCYVDPDRHGSDLSYYQYHLADRLWWRGMDHYIEIYRVMNGHPPRNHEELNDAGIGMGLLAPPPDAHTSRVFTVDVAITSSNSVFFMGSAGPVSPWLLPYGYENRRGLDENLFRGSPANRDRQRLFSVKVDEGVFAYSFAGQAFAREYRRTWWTRYGPRFAGAGLLLFSIISAFVLTFRRRRGVFLRNSILGSFLTALGIGGFLAVNMVTCYIMSSLFHRRDPAAIRKQIQMLEKYRESGVISDETYRRILSAIPTENND